MEPRTELETDFRRVRVWLLLPAAYLLVESFGLLGPTLRVVFQKLWTVPEQWVTEASILFRMLSLVFLWVAFVPRAGHHLLGVLRRLPESRAWLWILPAGIASYGLSLLLVLLSRGHLCPVAPNGVVRVLLIVVAAPLVEELFFRNLLFVRFRIVMGALLALLLSAALFAAVHPGAFFDALAFAILCQVAYLHARSLWAPIAVHAVHNSLAVHQSLSPLRDLVEASNKLHPAQTALLAACLAAPLLLLVCGSWSSLRQPI